MTCVSSGRGTNDLPLRRPGSSAAQQIERGADPISLRMGAAYLIDG
jgi:hypothetical protein